MEFSKRRRNSVNLETKNNKSGDAEQRSTKNRIQIAAIPKFKRCWIPVLISMFLSINTAEAISRSLPAVDPVVDPLLLLSSSTLASENQLLTSASTVTPVSRLSSPSKIFPLLPSSTSPSSSSSASAGPSSVSSNKIATVTPLPSSNGPAQSKINLMESTTAEDNSILRQRMPPGILPFDDEDEEDSDEEGHPHNTTRERDALQEEGSHHQPVVFIGGPGYAPPSNLRPRPPLDAEVPWPRPPTSSDVLLSSSGLSGTGGGPIPSSRYPYPLQTAWDRNYRNPFNMTRVQHIEAECQDDFMKLRVSFNGSFQGLIYSSGFAYDNDCVYVNGTGRDYYEYLIRLNRCGTLGASNHVEGRKEPSKNFMWNTVTVQYNPMIEEEWDEHFKVTCEYGYDFWKTVTFKPFDVEVATGNPVLFTLSPPECYMEVRYGFGATGTRVGGPVRVGDPLTLMIYMRSQFDGFDLVVNDCYAHNGGTKRIQLIDHYGCPVDSKLMSPFRGTWSHTNVYETQVYAYLKTFRFTGSPALYIECDVRMCHGQCPSQPCYWRNVKNIAKRSISDELEKNSTMSESINLSQALTVLQDQEDSTSATQTDTPDSICLKTTIFSALFGLGSILLATLTMISVIACLRLRRTKELSQETSNIMRPYSSHLSPTSPPTAQPHHNRHWSTTPTCIAKTRVP